MLCADIFRFNCKFLPFGGDNDQLRAVVRFIGFGLKQALFTKILDKHTHERRLDAEFLWNMGVARIPSRFSNTSPRTPTRWLRCLATQALLQYGLLILDMLLPEKTYAVGGGVSDREVNLVKMFAMIVMLLRKDIINNTLVCLYSGTRNEILCRDKFIYIRVIVFVG